MEKIEEMIKLANSFEKSMELNNKVEKDFEDQQIDIKKFVDNKNQENK